MSTKFQGRTFSACAQISFEGFSLSLHHSLREKQVLSSDNKGSMSCLSQLLFLKVSSSLNIFFFRGKKKSFNLSSHQSLLKTHFLYFYLSLNIYPHPPESSGHSVSEDVPTAAGTKQPVPIRSTQSLHPRLSLTRLQSETLLTHFCLIVPF